MNDRYLFRGKGNPKYNDGEWYYGHLIYDGSDYQIVDPEYGSCKRTVIPETVGQCTGLTDKNDKLIFEGDIVKINSRVASSETRETAETEIGFVKYDIDECEYRITHVNGTIPEYGKNYSLNLWRFKRDTNEVIGNIHDNPELLEVKR